MRLCYLVLLASCCVVVYTKKHPVVTSFLKSRNHERNTNEFKVEHWEKRSHESKETGSTGSSSVVVASSSSPAAAAAAEAATVAERKGSSTSSIVYINCVMFMFYATLGSALPFIPTYYRMLGFQDLAVGLLGAISPAVTFVASPLWAAMADRTGRHKAIMLFTFVFSVLTRCLLVFEHNTILPLALLVASSAILAAPVKPLMDSAVMGLLAIKADYGKSRIFGQLGFGFGSALVGRLLNDKETIKYIFAVHALLALPTAAMMLRFSPKTEKTAIKKANREEVKVFESIKRVMLNDPSICVLFVVIFVVGLASGIIENFAYIQLNDVLVNSAQKGQNVIGTCRLVSSICGAPAFWLSAEISKVASVDAILLITLLSYIARFWIYATIKNPWFALPAEALRGLTFALFWAGATCYLTERAPRGTVATMLGLLNAFYHGIGQSTGSALGGVIAKQIGVANTFKACSKALSAFTTIFTFYMLALERKRYSRK